MVKPILARLIFALRLAARHRWATAFAVAAGGAFALLAWPRGPLHMPGQPDAVSFLFDRRAGWWAALPLITAGLAKIELSYREQFPRGELSQAGRSDTR